MCRVPGACRASGARERGRVKSVSSRTAGDTDIWASGAVQLGQLASGQGKVQEVHIFCVRLGDTDIFKGHFGEGHLPHRLLPVIPSSGALSGSGPS